MDKLLVGLGVWILSDGVYSWVLYLNAEGYNGKRQTFRRDHWIRLVRILCGAGIITAGVIL